MFTISTRLNRVFCLCYLILDQITTNPIGPRIVDMFFHNNTGDKLFFEDFAKTFAVFRPVKSYTPSYGINSREAKVEKCKTEI